MQKLENSFLLKNKKKVLGFRKFCLSFKNPKYSIKLFNFLRMYFNYITLKQQSCPKNSNFWENQNWTFLYIREREKETTKNSFGSYI